MSRPEKKIDPEPQEDHSFLGMLKTEWPQVKKILFQIACAVFGGLVIIFLYEKFLIPGKDGELRQKDETIRTISEERDKANRENERLAKNVSELRIYRSQEGLPLKTKGLILARQIREFTITWKDTDPPSIQSEHVFKYQQRFGLRASIMRDDLDQNGQHSDEFDRVIDNFSGNYKDIAIIAAEIEKLAKQLPD